MVTEFQNLIWLNFLRYVETRPSLLDHKITYLNRWRLERLNYQQTLSWSEFQQETLRTLVCWEFRWPSTASLGFAHELDHT